MFNQHHYLDIQSGMFYGCRLYIFRPIKHLAYDSYLALIVGGKTKFKQGWLANLDSNGDCVSMYLKEESVHRARCDWCSCDFDAGSRGFLSIKDHSSKNKYCEVSEFYYFEFSKEMEIQVVNLRQGRTLS